MHSPQSHMCLNVAKDAIFIADSHGEDSLIRALCNLSPLPSQIFLLGDISNILVGNLKSSVESNKSLISALKDLSAKTHIVYFEGNHDFHISHLLPQATIIPRARQPLLCKHGDKNVLLAHGDIFLNNTYEAYIRILTSSLSAKILSALDSMSNGRIYRMIDLKVQNKSIKYPRTQSHIDAIIGSRLRAYANYVKTKNLKIDMVIEGHFHISMIKSAINTQECGESSEDMDFVYVCLPSFFYEKKAFFIGQNRTCVL